MVIYPKTSSNDGTLVVTIPRALLDIRTEKQDANFFTLVNGEEVDYKETADIESRTLTIPFHSNPNEIEIIASSLSGPGGPPPEKSYCGLGGTSESKYYHLLSPLKQFRNDIPIENIHCKEGLILIQKYDGSPACVTVESSFKLSERGWEIWRETITIGPIDPDLP